MQELIEILGAMTKKKSEGNDSRDLFLDIGERIVKSVSSAFGTKSDEVAILMLTVDNKHLRFVSPRRFSELGTIPVTKRDAIAVNVLGRKTGEAMNNVPMVKHVAFFESVKLRGDRAVPIQKMITVPILDGDSAIGVAQISRKGESSSDAGPDFTPADVQRAQDFFQSVAHYLIVARPASF